MKSPPLVTSQDGGAGRSRRHPAQRFFISTEALTSLDRQQRTAGFVGQIAARAKTAVFIADYSLAPERMFPGAVDEARAVSDGLVASGVSRLMIAGDSAGGGLALFLLLTADAEGEGLPKALAAVVISPWTDLALTGESMTRRAKADPMLTREALEQAAQLYLGSQDRQDPRASPLHGNMTGLPPVLFHVGEDEILLDDSRRFASCMEAAGAVAQLHIWKGMTHVFAANPSLQGAREALDSMGEFLRRTFNEANTVQAARCASAEVTNPFT